MGSDEEKVTSLLFTKNTDNQEIPLHFAYRRLSVNNQYKETFHSHLGIEILCIHQGKGTMIVNNCSYEIKPGMLCIFQPYQLHHLQLDYSNNQSFERSIAIFEPTLMELYFENWPALHAFYKYIYRSKLPSPCLYGTADHPELTGLFQNMNERLPLIPEPEKFEEISLFIVGLFRVLKRLWQTPEEPSKPFPTRKNHQMENILTWIEAHYTEPFQLEVMSKALHLSPHHLSHLFKEATGTSISEYMATRRAHQAALLLTTTDKSVSLIAEEVGITNSSYFCKLFKTQMGTTPHQYRKRWGK